MARPQTAMGLATSTPISAAAFDLAGGHTWCGVAFTSEEMQALECVYGFDLCGEALFREGSRRNLFRQAEIDGLRVMALLGRHLDTGEDPVQLIARGLAALGFDVTDLLDEEEES